MINGIAIVFEVDVSGEVRIRINGIELDSLMRIKPPEKLRQRSRWKPFGL